MYDKTTKLVPRNFSLKETLPGITESEILTTTTSNPNVTVGLASP